MKKLNVGVLGCTGMVGQRFVKLLENHPYFNIKILAASHNSKGKIYKEAVSDRWSLNESLCEKVLNLEVYDAVKDIDFIVKNVDFVFCALSLEKEQTLMLEELYAKKECPVVSNNSAHRNTKDVPMVIPELNFEHLGLIVEQKKRLNTKKGFIAVKSNCSLQSYLPPLYLLKNFGLKDILVSTYQAVSGAGKTLNNYKDMIDNVIPYIDGEEEKSEREPFKILSEIKNGKLVKPLNLNITSQCVRVPVSDGHLSTVFIRFVEKPTIVEIKNKWNQFNIYHQNNLLPSSPQKFIHYFYDVNMPQTKLHRNIDKGMAICVGRLREDTQYDYKFVCLSHNTIRGAAGGAILLAELLYKEKYLY